MNSTTDHKNYAECQWQTESIRCGVHILPNTKYCPLHIAMKQIVSPTERDIDELDKILHTAKVNWETSPDEIFDKGVTAYAKQAITSLIKELVAEAKPINKQGGIDIDEPAYNDGYYSGAYNTLEKFEQNILKALEDK